MAIIVLAVAGLCFGSFVNALVWRLRQQSIVDSGRLLDKKQKKLQTKNYKQKIGNIGNKRHIINITSRDKKKVWPSFCQFRVTRVMI